MEPSWPWSVPSRAWVAAAVMSLIAFAVSVWWWSRETQSDSSHLATVVSAVRKTMLIVVQWAHKEASTGGFCDGCCCGSVLGSGSIAQ